MQSEDKLQTQFNFCNILNHIRSIAAEDSFGLTILSTSVSSLDHHHKLR